MPFRFSINFQWITQFGQLRQVAPVGRQADRVPNLAPALMPLSIEEPGHVVLE
jgi:hypothetical protein